MRTILLWNWYFNCQNNIKFSSTIEPSFQAPHQHQEPQEADNDGENEQNPVQEIVENPEERLNRFRNEMLRNMPNNR